MTDKNLLVTGASGQLGRRVVELLLSRGAKHIVAASRTPAKLADLKDKGVTTKSADFDNPSSLEQAFAGVERLLIVSTDDLAPGRRHEQQQRAIDAAKRAGVRHVVFTSLTSTGGPSPIQFAADHTKTEAALKDCGLSHTVLRNNLYTELLLGSLPRAIASGKLVAAAGDGGASYVTREDCARAAAGALLRDFNGSETLEVAGPDVVTHAQLAKLASEISGKPVEYVSVPVDALVQGMVQGGGLPEPIARLFASFDVAIAQGVMAVRSDAVRELWGEAPTTVASFLQANRAALG